MLGSNSIALIFIVAFLIYPATSTTIFSAFACVDVGDGGFYLKADLSINCADPYFQLTKVYAGIMIIVFPLGIPA